MNRNIIKSAQVALTVAAAITLSACGGGSGGGTTAAQTSPTTPTTQTGTVAIVTTAPTPPSYTGEELIAYNNVNGARTTCGFGYLQQNAMLDLASYNHVVWEVRNNTTSHFETVSTPGFTGNTPGARLNVTGYTSWQTSGEDIASLPSLVKPGSASTTLRALLGAPYHVASLMQGHREIGISLQTGGGLGSGADLEYSGSASTTQLVIESASSTTMLKQSQADSDVLTYPCQGVTGTATSMTGEEPSPIPSRNFSSQPAGQSIFIQAAAGRNLAITTASIITTVGSNPVPIAVTLTNANDPNHSINTNQAVILPDVPMASNTQYTVTIQGTNNGATFLKTFTFTTGN